MPLNTPTVDDKRYQIGPGVLKIGVVGTTPSSDIGSIAEDGISIVMSNEIGEIRQGNPQMRTYLWSRKQDVEIEVNALEVQPYSWYYAMGSGTTTFAAGSETFSWGGDPLITTLAMHIQHQMISGQTMDYYVWKASSMGGFELTLSQDPTEFPHKWAALRATTDWAGQTLGSKVQYIRSVYTKT